MVLGFCFCACFGHAADTMRVRDLATGLNGGIRTGEQSYSSTVLIKNVRAENVSTSSGSLQFDVTFDFEASQGAHLNNMLLVQVPEGGRKYWVSTHDFQSAEDQKSGTLHCTVTIPQFKPSKQKTVPISVVVWGRPGGGVVDTANMIYDPGQKLPKQLDMNLFRNPIGLSIKASSTITVP
jgi:hypothetical protein